MSAYRAIMNKRTRTFGVATITAVVMAFSAVPLSAVHPQRVIDRASVDCSMGAIMQVDLSREGRKLEADVEIYTEPRERWTLTFTQSGKIAHQVKRSANREGELNVWRYLPIRNTVIEVNATSQSGETCAAKVAPR